jgi:hypothetical protein
MREVVVEGVPMFISYSISNVRWWRMVVGHGQFRNFRIVVYLNVLFIGPGSLSGVSDESCE